MAAPDAVVNIDEKLTTVTGHWSPYTILEFNGLHVKVVKVLGEFMWHDHPETDEVFLVRSGHLDIEVESRSTVSLGEGDMYVVPKGVRHRPMATEECELLLIEPAGVLNTGDTATATCEKWV